MTCNGRLDYTQPDMLQQEVFANRLKSQNENEFMSVLQVFRLLGKLRTGGVTSDTFSILLFNRHWQNFDCVDKKYTNLSSTVTKTNQEPTKMKCVRSYPMFLFWLCGVREIIN